jgi:hypothetical protein
LAPFSHTCFGINWGAGLGGEQRQAEQQYQNVAHHFGEQIEERIRNARGYTERGPKEEKEKKTCTHCLGNGKNMQ